MTVPDLKPCPACGGASHLVGSSIECEALHVCHVIGPRNDPDGAKWNALPRRGSGKEMEELREFLKEWRRDFPDDLLRGSVRLRVRRAIDAVLAAAPQAAPLSNVCCQKFDECREPCVERGRHQRDAEVEQLTKERDEAREDARGQREKAWAALGRPDGADDEDHIDRLIRERDELRAVVASFATEREERDAVAARLAKQRDEAIAKRAEAEQRHDELVAKRLNDPAIRDVNAAEARARKAEVACSRLGAESGKLRQQIAALKELVREFAREGSNGK